MAKDCEYGTEEDNMIRDIIVFGVHDKHVQERMLRDSQLTLLKAMDICRAAESSRRQMLEMGKSDISVDALASGTSAKDKKDEIIRCSACDGKGHQPHECPTKKK